MSDLLPSSLPPVVVIIIGAISATLVFPYASLAVIIPCPNARLAPIVIIATIELCLCHTLHHLCPSLAFPFPSARLAVAIILVIITTLVFPCVRLLVVIVKIHHCHP
jgi:hypothetical protein